MILNVEQLQGVCKDILPAVDSFELSTLTETLQLKVENSILYLAVTNREYYVKVRLDVTEPNSFNATVNANLFLKLVAQTTSDVIELTVTDKTLNFKGNGNYKLPLIFDGETLLQLPEIVINNPTVEFDIDSEILEGIYNYNTKQLSMNAGSISKVVQKMYYVDENGCITFTLGACVNNFTLPKPVKVLFNQRLVKLFKLFKEGSVHFTLGYDAISNTITQSKIKLTNNRISITAILSCDDTMINSVPAAIIRQRASANYPYSVTVNKKSLMDMVNRMKLFINTSAVGVASYAKLTFNNSTMTIADVSGENAEVLTFDNELNNIDDPYTMCVDLNDLLGVLDTCSLAHVNINFGDGQALTISRGEVINVIPEVKLDVA